MVENIKNIKLYEKLKAFVVECIDFLKKSYKTIGISQYGISYKKSNEIPPYYFVKENESISQMYKYYHKIQELESYKKLFNLLENKQEKLQQADIFEFLLFSSQKL